VKPRLLVVPLAAAGLMLGLPGVVFAADYCVGNPSGCTGTNMGTDLQGALDAAAATDTTADRVFVGPGTYNRANGFDYDEGPTLNTVEIRGVGSPKPTLTMPTAAPGESTLTLIQSGSLVDNLALVIPNLSGNLRGLDLSRATAQNLTITGVSSPLDQQQGVRMAGTGNVLTGSVIDVSTTFGVGVYDLTSNGSVIRDNTITASRGIDLANQVGGGTGVLRRNRISASANGLYMYYGDYDIDNTLIDLRGGNGSGIQMGTVTSSGNPSNTVDASHLTIRNGDATSVGILQAESDTGATESINLSHSIVWDIGHPIFQATPPAGTTFTVNVTSANYDSDDNLPLTPVGPGQVRNEASISEVDPRFIDPVFGVNGLSGDYRLAHSSPLIDSGSALAAGSGETDLRGLSRVADGDGAGGANRDLGAYEYQRAAPEALATGGSGLVSVPISFDASGSTDIDGDALTFAWIFDDGGSATGAQPTHAFATAGTHSATLTVTDAVGLTDTATATATVSSPITGQRAAALKKCKKKKKKARKKCRKRAKRLPV
jgi:hypothetical protein